MRAFIAIPEEMLTAGVETLKLCKKDKCDPATTALQVYLAMQAVRELLEKPDEGSVH